MEEHLQTAATPGSRNDARRAREIESAQGHTRYTIGGRAHERIRYGDAREGGDPPLASCPDCGAAEGQLHVPGCDVEVCPACGGRVVSCDCPYGL